MAGIKDIHIDNLGWIKEDLSNFDIKSPFVLFVPGSAPQHPQKRWPTDYYIQLAEILNKYGYQVVLIGTDSEKEITQNIENQGTNILNLTGKTTLFQIASLAQKADTAIGNDTGPMHMIGPTGCKTITLFSSHSNPNRHAPKGDYVFTIQENNLNDLSVETVTTLFKEINKGDSQEYLESQ